MKMAEELAEKLGAWRLYQKRSRSYHYRLSADKYIGLSGEK